MRTMMKKCGIVVALAAVLLTAAALIMGCPAASGPQSGPQHHSPDGMGAVCMNFNQTIQRMTILPDDVTLPYFADGGFWLEFSPVGGGQAIDRYIQYGDRNNPIDLDEDDYTLKVIAYLDWNGGTPQDEAATGVVTLAADDSEVDNGNPIVVTADSITNIKIMLHAIVEGDGTGTFKWDITFPTPPPNTATMTLTPLGDTALAPVNVKTTPQDEDTFTVGYYYVDFELEAGTTTNPKVYTFRHILHIYENMVSEFEYEFGADYSYLMMRGVIVDDWSVAPFENYAPELESDDGDTQTPLDDGDTVTVSTGNSIDIIVANYDDVDGDGTGYATLTWSSEGSYGNVIVGGTFTIDIDDTPFDALYDEVGLYPLTIEGTIDGVPYGTEIFIKVE